MRILQSLSYTFEKYFSHLNLNVLLRNSMKELHVCARARARVCGCVCGHLNGRPVFRFHLSASVLPNFRGACKQHGTGNLEGETSGNFILLEPMYEGSSKSKVH
jgi:hypothetical protein